MAAVIALVAIMAVVALPRLTVLPEFEKRGLHDKLAAELQFARKAAIANRRYVCVSTSNGTGGKVSLTIESLQPESSTGVCSIPLNPPAPDTTLGCSANQVCASKDLALSA